jgi:hypothetical protein
MRSPSRFAVVIAAALVAAAPPILAGFAGTDLFLPMVGRQAGVYPSNWYTTVWVHNPGAQAATARIYFLERNTANLSPPAVDVLVGPGDTEKLENVVESLFHRQAYGALRVTCATQKLVVTSRVFSKVAGEDDIDSMGQDFAGVPASFAIGLGERTQVLGVHQTVPSGDSEFRFNFGFVETTGNTTNVRVTAYDDNGALQGSKEFNVREFSQRQVAFKDHFPTLSTENTRLEVEVISGSGKVIAYGSMIANASQDPTTFEMTYSESLLAGGIAAVQHDATLVGDGTAAAPLGLANGAVSLAKIATTNAPGSPPADTLQYVPPARPQVLATDGSTLSWQDQAPLTLPWSGQPPQPVAGAAFEVANPSPGLFGISGSGGAAGLRGTGDAYGVLGECTDCIGVRGTSGSGTAVEGLCVLGTCTGVHGGSADGPGVSGSSNSGYGVHGWSGTGDGVFGQASVASKSGIYGANTNPAGYAGYFAGRVGITGDLSCTNCIGDGDLAGGAVGKAKLSAPGGTAGQVLGTDGAGLRWQNDGVTLPFQAAGEASGRLIEVTNAGSGQGIAAIAPGDAVSGLSSGGHGVYGRAGAPTGLLPPVRSGVLGDSAGGIGVTGVSASYDGVRGYATGANRSGVYGEHSSYLGYGVFGRNPQTSATGYLGGVYGVQGARGQFEGTLGSTSAGVTAWCSSSQTSVSLATPSEAVFAENPAAGTAAYIAGPYGASAGRGDYWGYLGVSDAGVEGQHAPSGSVGILGRSYAGVDGSGPTGVIGHGSSGDGVYGSSNGGYGVHGHSETQDALFGEGSTPNKAGIYAINPNGNWAGYFGGNVHVTGNLSAGGAKPFRIDHPLDPENRELWHAAVESSEVLNVYSGTVVLDAAGEAVVHLPRWFEALNADVRYQLTCIGAFAPIYIAEKVAGGSFRIAGGIGGLEVSWQLTARRNDPGLRRQGFDVERDKPPAERGSYLDPEAYGQPEELGVQWALRPETMRRIKERLAAGDQR